MVRSLGLDDRNLFITEIHMSCKSKEVVDVKMKGHLIGIVMTNRLFFLPIMTISGSVTILQIIGKSKRLLNELTKQHPFLRWQNLVEKSFAEDKRGLKSRVLEGLDKYFILSFSNAFFIKEKMVNCVLQRFSHFRISWWLSSHLQRTIILPSVK